MGGLWGVYGDILKKINYGTTGLYYIVLEPLSWDFYILFITNTITLHDHLACSATLPVSGKLFIYIFLHLNLYLIVFPYHTTTHPR